MALALGLVQLTIALLGGPSAALTIPEVIITLSLLTQQNDGAHAGSGHPDHCSPCRPSTALTIPEVIITLSLLTQQNDGAHAGSGHPDHRSPWLSLYSSNYS